MNRRCPRLRRVALPLWLTLAAAARPADAGPNLTPYPSFRALRPAGAEAARSIGRCELDEELLAATDDAYANLRVVDDRDTEIPFLARTARHTRSVTNDVDLAARTLSLRTLADNRIEVLLEVTHPETAPAALVLYSDQKDFEKHVSVYGSDDRANWQPLALRQPVFDYSRFMDVRHTRVELPGKAFRWFKLDIANISETNQSPLIQISRDWRDGRVFSAVEQSAFRRADFRIERVQFLERRVAEIKAEPIRRAYTVRDLRVEHKPREQQTVATFATDRPPLTALELAVDTPNFSRAVRLEGTNDEGDKAAWRPLAAGAVQRIAVGAFQRRQTRLELGRPCRFRRYRLTIDNLDSPPLALTAIAAEGETQELLFFTAPGRTYRLFYGARDAVAPRYDIGTVLAAAASENADAYALGAAEPNPGYRPARARGFPESRALLLAAATLTVAVLGWIMSRALRLLDAAGAPPA